MSTSYTTLLRRFFEDRDFDERTYEGTSPSGETHIFTTGALIEQIQAVGEWEAKEIWAVIQRLDVTNQPEQAFHDYFAWLVEQFAQAQAAWL